VVAGAAKDMVEAKEEMEGLGHEVIIQDDIMDFVSGKRNDDTKWDNLSVNPLKEYYPKILNADGILAVNVDKYDINNYIGGSTLMEIGLAAVNDKKIFILNDLPDMKYTDDIQACNPIILNGNLNKIK
jgi:hypothetical protein